MDEADGWNRSTNEFQRDVKICGNNLEEEFSRSHGKLTAKQVISEISRACNNVLAQDEQPDATWRNERPLRALAINKTAISWLLLDYMISMTDLLQTRLHRLQTIFTMVSTIQELGSVPGNLNGSGDIWNAT